VIRPRLATRAACILLVCAAACHKKAARTPDVAGLAAVPASAEVVIAADVPRVAGSPLVQRAVDQLLLRDPELASRWQQLRDRCKLDVGHVHDVVLAIGPPAGNKPGTGPVLMVATGQLSETQLASCVRAMVGQGGGTLSARPVGQRTLYEAKDGNQTMYFAFSRADTVVLGTNAAFVTEAISAGKKALDNPDLARWIGMADQKAPLWAAGRVDPRVREGLVRVTSGKLSSGPEAMVLSLDPTSGAKLEVGAVMTSPQDAKTLETFAKSQIGLLAAAAQARSLGPIVDAVQVSADGSLVRFHVQLSIDDVNRILSALDGGGAAAQDSPPASGPGSAGSATGSQR
jgi:hypothetical protein